MFYISLYNHRNSSNYDDHIGVPVEDEEGLYYATPLKQRSYHNLCIHNNFSPYFQKRKVPITSVNGKNNSFQCDKILVTADGLRIILFGYGMAFYANVSDLLNNSIDDYDCYYECKGFNCSFVYRAANSINSEVITAVGMSPYIYYSLDYGTTWHRKKAFKTYAENNNISHPSLYYVNYVECSLNHISACCAITKETCYISLDLIGIRQSTTDNFKSLEYKFNDLSVTMQTISESNIIFTSAPNPPNNLYNTFPFVTEPDSHPWAIGIIVKRITDASANINLLSFQAEDQVANINTAKISVSIESNEIRLRIGAAMGYEFRTTLPPNVFTRIDEYYGLYIDYNGNSILSTSGAKTEYEWNKKMYIILELELLILEQVKC